MLTEQLTLIEDLTSSLEGTDFIILRAEYLLTKYETAFTLWYRNSKVRKKELKKETENIRNEIVHMRATIKEKEEEYPFVLSKLTLRIALHDYHNFSLEDSEVKKIEDSVKIFQKFKSWKLVARA